nr:retrovirus-related Pol polyprotein from transposon TNT 1-94 [Tanacetum cinerariifolium]
MAAGSRYRPPILATGRYLQWRSRFLRFIDTRPNGEALRKCILSGPYKPTTVVVQAVVATDGSPAIPKHTTVETPMNMSPTNKAHFESEKEAIHLILTGVGDEIYSTVYAFQIAQEMWEAIERLRQGESLNIQDVKTNLFREFALVAPAQANQDPYYQTPKSQKSYAPSSKPPIPTRTQTTTRYKGKEIAKPITPPSESTSEEDNDPEQAQRDKDIQKNLALIAKYFKKIYKPTNNNLRTSSNSKTRMWIRLHGMQNAKRVKDSVYHKEKMLLCKLAEKGVPLEAEQYDWLADTDEEIDEQELEAHYTYMEKIQEVPTADTCTDLEPLEKVQNDTGYNVFANDLQHFEQSESISNTCLVETDDSNVIPDSPDMCDDDIHNDQNDVKSDDERVALANLIANLKLDVGEKKSQKQLKKADTKLAQELKECKTILAETSKTLGESNSIRDSCLVALQNKHTEFEKLIPDGEETLALKRESRSKLNKDSTYLMPVALKTQNDSFIFVHELKQKMHADLKYVEYLKKEIDKLESDKAEFSNIYDMILQEFKECDCLAQKLSKQTKFVSNEVHTELLQRFAKVEKHSISLEIALQKCKEQNIAISELKKLIEKGKGKYVETKFDKPSVVRQPNAQRFPKPSVLGQPAPFSDSLERRYFSKTKSVPKTNVSEGVNHKTNVSKPQHRSNQLKDKVVTNNSQGNDLLTGNRGSDIYTIFLQESTSSTPLCLMAKASPTQAWLRHRRLFHLNFDYINLLSKKDVLIGLPKLKYIKDQLCSSCELSKTKKKLIQVKGCSKDGEHLDKMKEKGDMCILVGYSTQSKGYRVYNKRTRLIVESIHIRFDEIKEMSETSIANDTSGLVPQRKKASDYDNSKPIEAMQEELHQFHRLQVWELVYKPFGKSVIRQKWLWKNKKDEDQTVIRNKGRLVAKGYAHEEDADLSGNPVDQTDYRSKIESLMYLTSSRPDIVQAGSSFGLTAFSDVDHTGCIDTRKSTFRGIQFLSDKLVSWMSKKQDCTAMSSGETEYVALSASALPKDRFKYLVRQIGIRYLNPAEPEVLAKEYA